MAYTLRYNKAQGQTLSCVDDACDRIISGMRISHRVHRAIQSSQANRDRNLV